MIRFTEGNIFESPAQTLVNTVNTEGVMGKGIAKEFKRLFPGMFKEYQLLCEDHRIQLGKLWMYRTPHKLVLNFPTKEHWRQPSRIKFIRTGLARFVDTFEDLRISSIAFPRLGCGNGELDWKEVKPVMQEYLTGLPIDIYIYEKFVQLVPEHKNIKMMKKWLVTEPSSYPFAEVEQDIKDVLKNKDKFTFNNKSFQVEARKDGTVFSSSDQSFLVPWRGGEFAHGWLEIWQYLREKGVCTTQDIERMGYDQPNIILHLMLSLNFLKELKMNHEKITLAVQLRPVEPQKRERDLFEQRLDTTQAIRLE